MNNSTRWMLPDGVDELLPSQARSLEKVRREILDLFDLHGFAMIQPPLIEFTDSLLIGLGDDVAKQSIRLTDQISGMPMAIRADVSSQAARIDAHSMQAEGVNRLCYVEQVVFAKPKTAGASRCPLMAGAEIFGDDSVQADIDIILLMLRTLRLAEQAIVQQGGSTSNEPLDLTLDLGHIGISRLLFALLETHNVQQETAAEIFDALQRKSIPDLNLILGDIDLPVDVAQLIQALPRLSGGVEILDSVGEALALLGPEVNAIVALLKKIATVVKACFPDVALYCDFSESRGYNYHTGLVFAVYSSSVGEALANGGRYDGVGAVFGKDRAATGFNTDLKVINRLLGAELQGQSNEDIVVAPHIEDQNLWAAVEHLRASGVRVVSAGEGEVSRYSKLLSLVDGEWRVVDQ